MKTKSRDLETLFRAGACGTWSDGQLLERFIVGRDEASFEILVRRHAPMVWGVCRRVLRKHHDAEDAFQATFLVLARKAGSVNQRETVANWLYAVAYQTARKARAMSSRREGREKQVAVMPEKPSAAHDLWTDLVPLLDEELRRLPDHYRAPIVLCDLEGKTRKEVARQLGWPEGTVSSRLARARSVLAKRLSRRGVALSSGMLAMLLAEYAVSATPPHALLSSTARTAALVAAGEAIVAGSASVKVVALTGGVLNSMFISKLKVAAAVLIAAGVLGSGLHATGRADQARSAGAQSGTAPAASTDKTKPNQPGSQPAAPRRLTHYEQEFRAAIGDQIGRDPASDDAFIRRVYLDILGRIPNSEEVQKYKEQQAESRSKLVEWLLREVRTKDQPNVNDAADKYKSLDDFLIQLHGRTDHPRWKPILQNCTSCHDTAAARHANAPETARDTEKNEIIRGLLVKQAVRDINQLLDRLKQDMPDRQTELQALDEIEQAVRTMKTKVHHEKN